MRRVNCHGLDVHLGGVEGAVASCLERMGQDQGKAIATDIGVYDGKVIPGQDLSKGCEAGGIF